MKTLECLVISILMGAAKQKMVMGVLCLFSLVHSGDLCRCLPPDYKLLPGQLYCLLLIPILKFERTIIVNGTPFYQNQKASIMAFAMAELTGEGKRIPPLLRVSLCKMATVLLGLRL